MAVLDSVYTLGDWAKEHDQDGKPVRVVNMLSKRMSMLSEMLWREANMADGHKTVVQTGLPEAIWKVLGRGVPSSRGTVAEAKFKTAIAATRSEVDKTLAELGGNVGEARMQRAERHMEAIKQKVQDDVLYGANDTDGFPGFTHVYSALTGSNASDNVITAGGSSGNQTSSFLVNWKDGGVYGIYPKGLPAGVEHIDVGNGGLVNIPDSAGNGNLCYVDEWRFHCGLVIEDWREAARICNIDISDLDAATAGFYEKLLRAFTEAYYRLPNGPGPNAAYYVPRKVAVYLHNAAVARVVNGSLSIEQFGGRPTPAFLGVPIRVLDNILLTESVVS